LRLNHWHEARKEASDDDLAACAQWIDFVEARQEAMHCLKKLVAKDELPLRITHNDTKCNNILFDDQDNAVCVIDLDTVMPGLIHFDFSDAVRTATTVHNEDEKDIEKIQFNMEALSQFCQGFITQIQPFVTEAELSTLGPTITYIPYLLGLRFFTDHLTGDVYFKTLYRGHNMIRARNQFRFVELLEGNQDAINKLIADICAQSTVTP
jgi:serine/threonine protein kinase